MCTLCSQTKGRQAIRELAKAMRDLAGTRPRSPGSTPISGRRS